MYPDQSVVISIKKNLYNCLIDILFVSIQMPLTSSIQKKKGGKKSKQNRKEGGMCKI